MNARAGGALGEAATGGTDRREPPGARDNRLLGVLRHVHRDRLGLMLSLARTYGDAVRIPMGPKALYFFNHPDYAKHVLSDNHENYRKGIGLAHSRRALGDGLLTSEGELWRTQRRVIQPVFQRERISRATEVIVDEAEKLAARWRTNIGRTVDVVEEMTNLTIGVLGGALLRTDLGKFDSIGSAFAAVQDQAMFEMVTLNTVPHLLPLARHRRFHRAQRQLEAMVNQLVADHEARSSDPDAEDLMSRLIASTNAEKDPKVGRRRLRDELVTLLLAGHETTASTLGWTWHLVGNRPLVWERLHNEAREVLGDGRPSYEAFHRLRYTTMVVEETIRLYPPVWILPRRAIDTDEVGGYHVPAGTDVMICPFTLHRHPEFWPDPERFDPDRFDPTRAADRPRYAYIPFGAGPRFCVGMNLGMLEATLVVAMIAREFQLRPTRGRRVVADPMMSLRVRGGLPMTIQPA